MNAFGVRTANSYAGTSAGNNLRFNTYALFINMQMAFDAQTGYLYVSRAYPYGFDRGFYGQYAQPQYLVIPHPWVVFEEKLWNGTLGSYGFYQNVRGCAGSPATFPTRVQINKAYIGSLANFGSVRTQPWTFVSDVGTGLGYKQVTNPYDQYGSGYVSQPAIQPALGMQDVGRDLGSGSFVTDRNGVLKRYGTTAYWLGGDDIRGGKTTGSADCYVTGLERVTLYTLP